MTQPLTGAQAYAMSLLEIGDIAQVRYVSEHGHTQTRWRDSSAMNTRANVLDGLIRLGLAVKINEGAHGYDVTALDRPEDRDLQEEAE